MQWDLAPHYAISSHRGVDLRWECQLALQRDVCPLCGGHNAKIFFVSTPGMGEPLDFYRCSTCRLTFKDPSRWPAASEEREHYLKHNNDLSQPGYRKFLSRLTAPLAARLPTRSGLRGLDFGCGPTFALAELLEQDYGLKCDSYDPFFCADLNLLTSASYDFITCSEVLEHMHRPREELRRLVELLNPGGWLAIMTGETPDDKDEFGRWHYHRDVTHVAFYSRAVFSWLNDCFAGGLRVEFPSPGVTLYQRSEISR